MNYRIYIEKKRPYDVHSREIRKKVEHIYSPHALQVYILYDIFDVSSEDLDIFINKILSDKRVDIIHHKKPPNNTWIAWEYLPGQYDQQSDACIQCGKLLGLHSEPIIRSGTLLTLSEDAIPYVDLFKEYLINPVDSKEKSLDDIQLHTPNIIREIGLIESFNKLNSKDLNQLIKDLNLSLSLKDMLFIQHYFQSEQRAPQLVEIKILDTYWSDHCRHNTFLTSLSKIEITGDFKAIIEEAFNHYLQLRNDCGRNEEPITLMDMATIVAHYFEKNNILNTVEKSEEINACSVNITVRSEKGEDEEWLLMFKNETHNHPTEIDPFGGASTCIGGAIRDPLSGRAYVYQAMRISGSGNPLESYEDTLINKLPQKKITQEAAQGFSSYGNQVGVTTALVHEFYDNGYKAKRLEAGLVVGAVPKKWVRRESPKPGDAVILIGGRTGKDGIGGASGSSKSIKKNRSSISFSSEVQKGNAPLERQLQRLFRNPAFLSHVKKSNDFGAGGVSVAVGELADGVKINLNTLPTKYAGMDALDLAISESQERMAIVCDEESIEAIFKLAHSENLEATKIAIITDEKVLNITHDGNQVAYLKRDFLDSKGVKREMQIQYADGQAKNPFSSHAEFSKKGLFEKLSSLNHCSQIGLINQFDTSIGKGTVLSPLGGEYQQTVEDIGAQLIPHHQKLFSTASVIAFGFFPEIANWSTFHSGIYSIFSSIAKLIASGVPLKQIYLSLQEYFERLSSDPIRWGKPFGSLLGAIVAQSKMGVAAIGGKDSMSGSYGNIDVPPTLISFAVGYTEREHIIASTLSKQDAYLYLFKIDTDQQFIPNWKQVKSQYKTLEDLQKTDQILAAKSVGLGGIAVSLCEMAWGNKVALEVNYDKLLSPLIGSIIVQTNTPLKEETYIVALGTTHTNKNDFIFNKVSIAIEESLAVWKSPLEPIFPSIVKHKASNDAEDAKLYHKPQHIGILKHKIAQPNVCIPIFPGTNCEYDTAHSFKQEGATVTSLVLRTQTQEQIKDSLKELQTSIQQSQILCFVGGFSYGDEPDGAAKYIATMIKNPIIYEQILALLDRGGLILGICNGFQALIKSGLLPFNGEENNTMISHNMIGRHVAYISHVRVLSALSPWVNSKEVGKTFTLPISHGEGRITLPPLLFKDLESKGQIIAQYIDLHQKATLGFPFNPNGSMYAIEAITNPSGQILGRMGHPERYASGLFKNIPHINHHNIFKNGIHYFK